MVFNILCILIFWVKVASALKGLELRSSSKTRFIILEYIHLFVFNVRAQIGDYNVKNYNHDYKGDT